MNAVTQAEFARRLAALKDYEAGGLYDPRRHYPGHIYFVPGSTLTCERGGRARHPRATTTCSVVSCPMPLSRPR